MRPLLVRFLSFALVLGTMYFGGYQYHLIVFSLGFSHYLLGLFYSPGPMKAVLSHRRGQIGLIGITAIATIAFSLNTTLSFLILFGIHLALSEAYDGFRGVELTKVSVFVRFLFHLSAYFLASFQDFSGIAIHREFLLLVPFSLLLYLTYRQRRFSMEHFGADGFMFLLSAIIVFSPPQEKFRIPLLFGLYHFGYWIFAPYLYRRNSRDLLQIALNLGIAAVFYFSLRVYTYQGPENFKKVFFQYALWAYIHSAISIAGSRYNPAWIRNFFLPSKPEST